MRIRLGHSPHPRTPGRPEKAKHLGWHMGMASPELSQCFYTVCHNYMQKGLWTSISLDCYHVEDEENRPIFQTVLPEMICYSSCRTWEPVAFSYFLVVVPALKFSCWAHCLCTCTPATFYINTIESRCYWTENWEQSKMLDIHFKNSIQKPLQIIIIWAV